MYSEDLEVSGPLELVVLSVKQSSVRCRLQSSDRQLTLRFEWNPVLVPGFSITVELGKHWFFAGHPYITGRVEKTVLDVARLGLVPLRLERFGTWASEDYDWLERDSDLMIADGQRPSFEMEQVLPGSNPDDPFDDPIIRANKTAHSGDRDAAEKILMDL